MTIKGWQDGDTIAVEIVDDGIGGATEARNGLGLSGARIRAEMLGGTFEIDSPPGHGTRLKLTLPDMKLPRLAPVEAEETMR
ncbi:ATP-binding protein [Actinoplanes sp. NPDC051346]|uniref:ATP-binding protein n=1 Tax=Actinoplanes sp. NPDC051346 TaxID=3155048 RepID=UPI003446C87C